VISYAVWLYFRFPLSLRMVEEMLAARSIEVTYETVRQWALKFVQQVAKWIRARIGTFGDKGSPRFKCNKGGLKLEVRRWGYLGWKW
jgi:hypothetical protein